jgi:hypothetical protein
MNRDDEQMLRDLRHFTRELLRHADVMSPDLAAMLRDYEPELYRSQPGRWDGTGVTAQSECLAVRIGQRMTDGEWPHGTRLDASTDHWYAWGQTRASVEGALRLLAARGELALKSGRYFTRSRDEGS